MYSITKASMLRHWKRVLTCRVLKAVKDRLHSSAAERQAKRKFKIEGANDVPKTMQVKQSPVSSNGHE